MENIKGPVLRTRTVHSCSKAERLTNSIAAPYHSQRQPNFERATTELSITTNY